MKTEKGILVMKKGKAWGKTYEDGHSTAYGWIDPETAPLYNPEFCKKPTDVTWTASPYLGELKDAKLVMVERITEVKYLD